MDKVVPILVIVGLVLINGLFVAAEFAIAGVPRASIEKRAAAGDPVAVLVRQILRNPRSQDQYIATAQLGITLASLGLGMYGEHVVAEWLAHWLEGLGASRWIAAHTLASVLAVAALTYLHIVVGEMVPKSLALQQAERTALWITRPMRWFRFAFYPLVVGLNAIGNGLLRLAGVDRASGRAQYHTAEELDFVVRESEEGGLLRAETGGVIRDLLAFGDRTAGQVMEPRVRVTGIAVSAAPAEIAAAVRASHRTRLPVYRGDLDHVVGVVHVKDLLRGLVEGRALDPNALRPVPYVPESAPLDAVFEAMRRERMHLAVVMDELGGTAGVVAIEDLFDEVIGEVEEESDRKPKFTVEADGALRVDGAVRLDEVGERFGRVVEHDEVDSVSGLVLLLLGRPPAPGDRVEYCDLELTVATTAGHGVGECLVRPAPGADDGRPSSS